MENSTIIILLFILLCILLFLNHVTLKPPPPPPPATVNTNIPIIATPLTNTCSTTRYGCCLNGITPKINFEGTNCFPAPYPPQPSPKPIGGCSSTQYGCCIDGTTPKINTQGSNCIIHS